LRLVAWRWRDGALNRPWDTWRLILSAGAGEVIVVGGEQFVNGKGSLQLGHDPP